MDILCAVLVFFGGFPDTIILQYWSNLAHHLLPHLQPGKITGQINTQKINNLPDQDKNHKCFLAVQDATFYSEDKIDKKDLSTGR